MQAALEIADDEGVAGDARAEVIGERSREVLARNGAERLAVRCSHVSG